MRPDNHIYHNLKYEAWIRSKPCLVCGQESEVHHVWNMGGKNKRNSATSVPLCVRHHRHGFPESYHELGKERFEDLHSINLEWEIINLLSEYLEKMK